MAFSVSELWTAVAVVLLNCKTNIGICLQLNSSHASRFSLFSGILDETLLPLWSENIGELRMSIDCAISYLEFLVDENPNNTTVTDFLLKIISSHLKFIKDSLIPQIQCTIADQQFNSLFEKHRDAVGSIVERVNHCHLSTEPLPPLPEYIVAQFDAEHAQAQVEQEEEPPNANDPNPNDADSDYSDPDFDFLSSDSFYNAQHLFPDWPESSIDYKIFLYALRHNHYHWANSWLQVSQATRDMWINDIDSVEATHYYDGVRLDRQHECEHDLVSWIRYFHETCPHLYNYSRLHTLIPMIFAYNPWITFSDAIELPRVVHHPNIFIDNYFKSGNFWELKFPFKFSLMLFEFMDIPMTFSML